MGALGAPANRVGLYQLARVARVASGKAAVNSFTARDFGSDSKHLPSDAYIVPKVDPTDPTQILLDATGQPVPLTQFDVVQMSNPERAAKAIAEAKAEATTGFAVPKGAGEKAQALRRQLETGLKAIQDLLTELAELSQAGDPAVGPPLGTRDDWARMSVVGNKVSSWITMNEPPETSSATEGSDPEEDEDQDAWGDEDQDQD